jgi:hypothetical protein
MSLCHPPVRLRRNYSGSLFFLAIHDHDFVGAAARFPGTKNQLKAMRTRNPAPIPNEAGEPIDCKIARLQNPPTKTEETAIILRSRDATRRAENSLGSAMSSHQTVVSTTCKTVIRCQHTQKRRKWRRTRRRKLRVHTLTHDTLQAHAHAHQSQTCIRARVGPRWLGADRGEAALPALPKRDRGGHSEERLDERAKEQP